MADSNLISQPCFRQDLVKSTVVFGSLLFAAAALCGTLDMTRPASALLDEVQALNDEHAIGPAGFDPYALDCHGSSQRQGRHRDLDSDDFRKVSNQAAANDSKCTVTSSDRAPASIH